MPVVEASAELAHGMGLGVSAMVSDPDESLGLAVVRIPPFVGYAFESDGPASRWSRPEDAPANG